MDEKSKLNEEIAEILKVVKKKKISYLTQTNINERDDLSQEIDLLIYQKLQPYFEGETSNFYEYLKANGIETRKDKLRTKRKGI